MQWRNSPTCYGAVSQALHWLVVILVIVAWLLGILGEDLPRGAARDTGRFVHILAGLALLGLVVLRFIWRMSDPPPPAETTALGRWADRAAWLTHHVLYLRLIAVPIVGVIAQFARGDALPVFGLFELASPWPADRAFARSVREVHEVLAHALVLLAALHAAAALVHHWVLHDRTLMRMLPG